MSVREVVTRILLYGSFVSVLAAALVVRPHADGCPSDILDNLARGGCNAAAQWSGGLLLIAAALFIVAYLVAVARAARSRSSRH